MRITELIRFSFRALTANKRRSLLTMLGIVIGITSVVTIMALGNGIKAATLKNLQTDQSGQQTAEITFLPESSTASTAGFKEDDVDLAYQTAPDKIKKVTIKHEKERLQLNGQLANQDTMLSATLVTSMPKVQLAAGHKLNPDSLQTDGHDVLLSKKLAKKVFHGNAAALTSSVFIGKRSYNIVGIFNTPKESYSALDVDVLIPEKAYTAGQLNPGGQKLAITFQRGSDISQLANAIVRQLKKSGTERRNGSYQYFDYGELLKGIGDVISGLTLFVGAIAGYFATDRRCRCHEHDVHFRLRTFTGNWHQNGRWRYPSRNYETVSVRVSHADINRRRCGSCSRWLDCLDDHSVLAI